MTKHAKKRAFLAGQYSQVDPNVERFRDHSRKLGYDFKELRGLAQAALQPQSSDLLLFCAGRDIKGLGSHLERISRPQGPQIVLYAHDSMISAETALDYSKLEQVVDVLVWEDTDPSIVEEHISGLHTPDSPIYPKLNYRTEDGQSPSRAFISTPMGGSHDLTMRRAVQPVLKECGFQVVRADIPCERSSVHDQIRIHITGSQLLVANIGECEIDLSRHNPNVYFEIGMAVAHKIPVLPIRPVKRRFPRREVPADISDIRRIEYLNEVDLVLQLFHGLKHRRQGP